jgi:hypothetical protein
VEYNWTITKRKEKKRKEKKRKEKKRKETIQIAPL